MPELTNATLGTAVPTAVQFEIEEDPLWVISGKRRANIQLINDTATLVRCRIRPISAGCYVSFLQLFSCNLLLQQE
jgi:hypothetical protein